MKDISESFSDLYKAISGAKHPVNINKCNLNDYSRNIFTPTGLANPFTQESMEHLLTQCIVENIELINNALHDRRTDLYLLAQQVLLKKLAGEQRFIGINSYDAEGLFHRGLWLCMLHGLVEIETLQTTHYNAKLPQFGVYCEEGFLDILGSKYFISQLRKMQPEENRHHLWKVLLCADILYQNAGILRINHDGMFANNKMQLPISHKILNELSIKVNSSGIGAAVVHNLSTYGYANRTLSSLHSIPLNTAYLPDCTYDADPQMRNIFHHIGDEIAFILAAIQVGDCYMIGSNDFGGNQVLGVFPSILRSQTKDENFPWQRYMLDTSKAQEEAPCLQNLFAPLQQVSTEEFTYIYSVPRTNTFYPAKKSVSLTYHEREMDNCKINDRANAQLHEAFWNNEVFLQNASRHIEAMTLNELLEVVAQKMKKTFLGQFGMQHWQQLVAFCHQIVMDEKNKKVSTVDLGLSQFVRENENDLTTRKDTCFFYKTIAHKVHCDIVNPAHAKALGFFKKNNGDITYCEHAHEQQVLDDATKLGWSHFIHHAPYFSIGASRKAWTAFGGAKLFDSAEEAALHMLRFYIFYNLSKKYSNDTSLFNYWLNCKEDTVVYSEVVEMENEYRMFMIDNRPVATSACFRNTTALNAWQHGVFDPRLSNGHSAQSCEQNPQTRHRVAQYAKFARHFGREMRRLYPEIKNYVLDVAWCPSLGKVVPIEVNSITWSGAYQINMERLVHAIGQQPYRARDSLTVKMMEKVEESIGQLVTEILSQRDKHNNMDYDDLHARRMDNIQMMMEDLGLWKTEQAPSKSDSPLNNHVQAPESLLMTQQGNSDLLLCAFHEDISIEILKNDIFNNLSSLKGKITQEEMDSFINSITHRLQAAMVKEIKINSIKK